MDPEIEGIITSAVDLALRYKRLTGKPLGITDEVAEFQAAKILGLTLAGARTPGYDAIGPHERDHPFLRSNFILVSTPNTRDRLEFMI